MGSQVMMMESLLNQEACKLRGWLEGTGRIEQFKNLRIKELDNNSINKMYISITESVHKNLMN